MPRALALAAALSLASGCVIRDAAEPRFFRVETKASDTISGDPQPSGFHDGRTVRLRSVTGAPFLRERIVWRSSPVEYHFYEQRRWLELPATYVERALLAELRSSPGLKLSDDSGVPVLSATVVAFDEIKAPAHVAKVGVKVAVKDADRRTRLDREFTAEEPIPDEDPLTLAATMSRALAQVAAQIGSAVTADLASTPNGHR